VVKLATTAGDLWVYGTHLKDPAGSPAERRAQVERLLVIHDGRTPAILAGDFNALPDSDVLAVVRAAGFADLGAALDPDAFTAARGTRIDYILATAGVSGRAMRIPEVWTSDHKPVVAEVTLEGADRTEE
jgi:endonuclease/exonuclease/phosphatase family metal-dependent hydrolase